MDYQISTELRADWLPVGAQGFLRDCRLFSHFILSLEQKPDKEEDSVLPQALWSQELWRCSAVRSRTADIHADHVHAVCQDLVLLPSSLFHCLSANRVSSEGDKCQGLLLTFRGVGGRERSSPDSVAPAAIGGPTSLDSLTFDLRPVPSQPKNEFHPQSHALGDTWVLRGWVG